MTHLSTFVFETWATKKKNPNIYSFKEDAYTAKEIKYRNNGTSRYIFFLPSCKFMFSIISNFVLHSIFSLHSITPNQFKFNSSIFPFFTLLFFFSVTFEEGYNSFLERFKFTLQEQRTDFSSIPRFSLKIQVIFYFLLII